jgi:hypothetical protein
MQTLPCAELGRIPQASVDGNIVVKHGPIRLLAFSPESRRHWLRRIKSGKDIIAAHKPVS